MCGSKGGPSGGTELHAHHKKPISRGGGHELANLVTLCDRCHMEIVHGDRILTDDQLQQLNTALSVIETQLKKQLHIEKQRVEALPELSIDGQSVYTPSEDSITVTEIEFSRYSSPEPEKTYLVNASLILKILQQNNHKKIEELNSFAGSLVVNPHSPMDYPSKDEVRAKQQNLVETIEQLEVLVEELHEISAEMSETSSACRKFEDRVKAYISILDETAKSIETIIEADDETLNSVERTQGDLYKKRRDAEKRLIELKREFKRQNAKPLKYDDLKQTLAERLEQKRKEPEVTTGKSLAKVTKVIQKYSLLKYAAIAVLLLLSLLYIL